MANSFTQFALAVVAAAALFVVNAPGTLAYCNIKRADVAVCWFSLQCYYGIGEVALPATAAACTNRSRYHVALHAAGIRRPAHLHPVSYIDGVVSLHARDNNWTDLPLAVPGIMPRLHTLHVPDNHIAELPAAALGRFPALRSLDLSYNDISELEPGTFNGTIALERLFLAYNNITDLDEDTFEGLLVLNILDLSHNSLMQLNGGVFRGLDGLETLYLNNNNILFLNGALRELFRLQHLHLRENKLHQIEIDEIPNFLHLQTLDVSNNTISSIQPEVFSRQGPAAATGGLAVLFPSVFSRLRAIGLAEPTAKIWLSRNKIVILENSSFVSVISEPKSRHPRHNAVETLDQIPTEIDLSQNLIDTIEFDAFSGIVMLVLLDLSSNKLEFFDVNTSNLEKLRILYLRDNHISTIDSKSYYNLRKLKSMDLSRNAIDLLEEHSFATLRDLTVLNLSNNGLTTLNSSSFERLTSLKVLDVSNNQLEQVSVSYLHFESLKKLSLHSNKISDISLVRLDYLLELESLDLSHNRIEAIDGTTLSHLYALKHLNVSFNNIAEIENSAFSSMYGLRFLDLSNNNLTSLDHGIFGGLSELDSLDLSDNSIGRLESTVLFELKSLKRLNLERNGMNVMDVEVWRGRKVSLRVDVGGNRLACSWLAAALGDAARGWSGVRLAATRRARGRVVDGIACEGGDAEPLQLSSPLSSDDRLLDTNYRILDAILTQTSELKKSLKSLSYSLKRTAVEREP